jgi:hypothetical protein
MEGFAAGFNMECTGKLPQGNSPVGTVASKEPPARACLRGQIRALLTHVAAAFKKGASNGEDGTYKDTIAHKNDLIGLQKNVDPNYVAVGKIRGGRPDRGSAARRRENSASTLETLSRCM